VTISASHGGCDADVFELTIDVDGTYTFETTNGCERIDTTLWLYDEAGVELDMNDDSNGLCSQIQADLAAGSVDRRRRLSRRRLRPRDHAAVTGWANATQSASA
jgi:hypothetical protein